MDTNGIECLDAKLLSMKLPEAPESTRAGTEIRVLDETWILTWSTREFARLDKARGPQATATDSWTRLGDMAETSSSDLGVLDDFAGWLRTRPCRGAG